MNPLVKVTVQPGALNITDLSFLASYQVPSIVVLSEAAGCCCICCYVVTIIRLYTCNHTDVRDCVPSLELQRMLKSVTSLNGLSSPKQIADSSQQGHAGLHPLLAARQDQADCVAASFFGHSCTVTRIQMPNLSSIIYCNKADTYALDCP